MKKTWPDCKRREFLVRRHNQTSSASPVPDFDNHGDGDAVDDEDKDV